MRRWLGRLEGVMDFTAAWFGGSAVTAFALHDPQEGLSLAVIAAVAAVGGLAAHVVKPQGG